MEVLVGLLLVVGVITLVGHGIWVVLAWFFRSLLDVGPSTPSKSLSLTPTELDDLAAVGRQLRGFLVRHEIDRDTYDRLQACVTARRDALLGHRQEFLP